MKVIVTGSEGLIGKSITSFLLESGHQVIRCDLLLGHNLEDESFVKKFFTDNKADALINLFALNDHIDNKTNSTDLFSVSLKSFEKYLKCNLVSLFSVCREYARNNKKGKIVNFSSTYGIISPQPNLYKKGNPKDIGYAVSKSGVPQLTRYLAVHLAPNITVNCVVPGGVERNHSETFKKKYGEKTPLGRMMKVEELNGIVKYLISNCSSYTTASTIHIDGGWTAW